ncbi:MAG: calcium-binding protein [Cellvibrionaceae bacterium]
MPSSPQYYVSDREILEDQNWLDSLSSVIAQSVSEIGGVAGQTKLIEFVVGAAVSGATDYATTSVAIELEVISAEEIRVGDEIYLTSELQLVDGILDASITTAATLFMQSAVVAAFSLVGIALTPAAIAAVGIVAAGGIAYGYSKVFGSDIELILDTLAGTVDVNLQLKDESGNIIGGVLYKDGLTTTEADAMAFLFDKAINEGMATSLEAGMEIEVVFGTGTPGNVYTTYSDDLLSDIATIQNGLQINNFNQSQFVQNYGDDVYFRENDGLLVGRQDGGFTIRGEFFLIEHILTGAGQLYGSPGSSDKNLIVGTDGDDNQLAGNGGNDTIYGWHGGDKLFGGNGHDTLYGDEFENYAPAISHQSSGNDNLFGGDGNDVLWGGAWHDHLAGDGGNDILHGGTENDRLYGNTGDDELFGDDGDDLFIASSGDDTFDGGSNSTYSTSELGSKNIKIDVGYAEFKGDTIDYSLIDRSGGAEWLFVELDIGNAFMTEDLSTSVFGSFDHTLINIENVIGSSERDYIIGSDQTNIFRTIGGSDHIEGKGGEDVFYVHEPQAGDTITIDGGDDEDFVFIDGNPSDYFDPKEITPGVWHYQHKQTLGIVEVTNVLRGNINIGGTVFIPPNENDDITINGSTTNHLQLESSSMYSGGSANTGNLSASNVQQNSATGETTMDVTTPDGNLIHITIGGGIIMGTAIAPDGTLYPVWYDQNGNEIDPNNPSFNPGTTIWWDGRPDIYVDAQGEVHYVPDLGGLPNYISASSSDVIFGGDGDDVLIGGGSPAIYNDDPDDIFDFLNDPAIITSPAIEGVYAAFGDAENTGSPLVLDLDGDGIELSSLLESKVFWDIDEDGFAENTGWVDADDGLLAIDLDSDGSISYHTELFGSLTEDGFTDLATLDSNLDGVIDANDAQFSDLLVWKDINQNAISGSDELFSLTELNITEIDLYASQQFNVFNEGHTVSHISSYTMDDGVNGPITREISDIWFEYDNINTIFKQSFAFDETTLGLPDQRGYGEIPNLYIAASTDNDLTDPESLISLLYQFIGQDLENYFTDDHSVMDDVETILFRWAGVDAIDPTSRGQYVDARKVEFLEKLFGEDYTQGSLPNPGTLASMAVNRAFEMALYTFTGRFIAQTIENDLFEGSLTYNYATDILEGVTGFNQDGLNALLAKSLDGSQVQDKMSFWVNVVNSIDHSVGLANISTAEITALENTIIASDSTITIQQLLDKRDKNIEDELSWTPDGDSISGTTGDDVYLGSVGDDVYLGNYGNDTLSGGLGNDIFYGSAGDDILDGQLGDDSLVGQGGADTYKYTIGHGDDFIQEQYLDVDKIVFSAGLTSNDILVSRIAGSDLFLQVDPNVGAGSITINGYVELMEFSDSTVIDIRTLDLVTHGTSGDDTLYGAKTAKGGSGVDTIYGYDGDDTLHAFAPNEVEYNDNYLDGGTGDDKLYGGRGDDFYYMGSGNDLAVDTVSGDDVFVYTGGLDHLYTKNGNDTLVLDIDKTINEISISTTGNYDATLVVDAGVNELFLQYQQHNSYKIENIEFQDGFYTDLGNFQSWQYGTSLAEIINGTSSEDTLIGMSGDDILYGFSGEDDLHGGTYSDMLYGGDGLDKLWGGIGADSFIFESASAFNDVDIIGDFDTTEGDAIDIIDLLSGYDPLSDAITDFVQITDNGTDSTISVDADGGADNFIQIATLLNVTGITDEDALETNGNLIAA